MSAAKPDPRLALLRKRVAKVPQEPGVYRWLDKDGAVMYVGKAKNLKNRMQTYVQEGEKRSAWTEIMVRQIEDFDVTVVRSELEALILESNLIKELKPKYNIMLKDDKGYVYVRVSAEAYPRVDTVRRMENDKAKYFGPFLGARDTNRTLEMLDGILKFHACKKSLDLLNDPPKDGLQTSQTPCLDYQIGKCNGLCIGLVTEAEYRDRIAEVERFFRGHFVSMKKKTEEQMRAAAAEKKFERAARIRDVLRFIDDLEQKQIVSDTSGSDADIFGIAMRGSRIQVMLLRQRDGKLIEQVGFPLKGEAESATEALEQFLPLYYADTQDIPETIIVGQEIADIATFEAWLKEKRGKVVRIVVPERGKKSKLLMMAERNAQEKVDQQFAAWEAEAQKVEGALLGLQELLGLSQPPKRIEGYDISHLGGTATVGSMVVMVNGKPKREHYRSFNMQSVKEGMIDDYKSIAETLRRRLKYLTQDLKANEKKWKNEGITFGKARKEDREKVLAKIHEVSCSNVEIDCAECIVARREREVIACGYVHRHPSGHLELFALWADDSVRGRKIGHIITQMLLKRVKKNKVYLGANSSLEDYYAEIGFRHVLNPSVELIAEIHHDVPAFADDIIMVFAPKDHKPDESFTSTPDLILIDGGKGQLSAAVEVLKELNLAIPIAGLAKREEEIFVPDRPVSLLVKEGSEPRFLLQRLRDEAHRFANDRRERRLAAVMTASKLDEVAGIGDGTKAELLKKFRSADAVIGASDQELATILNDAQLKALRLKFPRV